MEESETGIEKKVISIDEKIEKRKWVITHVRMRTN